ncbi:Sorting nexin mvp1 [Tilletia horrida]|uniref:Sorting nexin mvp1 n=1 Tax=Tilletia horrida TaxID=155126 RepID=A0AAN6JMN5_9BASI|nr:Sorting nexin mvp1 [Tilletia horrida]
MFNEPRSPPTGSSSMRAWATAASDLPYSPAAAPRVSTARYDSESVADQSDVVDNLGDDDDDDAAAASGLEEPREGLPASSATTGAGWSAAGAGQTLANEVSDIPHGTAHAPRLPSAFTSGHASRPGAFRSDSLSSHGTAAFDPWGASGAQTGIAPFAAGGAFVSPPPSTAATGRQLAPQRHMYAASTSPTGWSGSANVANASIDELGATVHQTPVIFSSLKPPTGLANMPGGAAGSAALPPSTSANWHSIGSNFLSSAPNSAANDSSALPSVRLSSSPTSESTNPVVQLFTQHNTYIISTPPSGLVGMADNAIIQHHADAGRQLEVERRYSDFTWLADILIKSCHPVLSKDDLVIVFFTEAQTITHWRSTRDPPLCPEEAYSHPLTEVEEMSIPSDLLPAKIQRTRAVLPSLVDRWRALTALFDRIARRREAEGMDWKRVSNIFGEMASLEGRRWRPELVGGGAGAGTLGRAYKRRNERQRASMFASSGPFAINASSGERGANVRHSSFLAAGIMEPSTSEDGRAGEFVAPGGGFGEESFGEDDLFADNKNATSGEEILRKVARACGDWSEGMKGRAASSLASTLEDIKYQRDLWAAFRDMLHRWDKLGPDNVDAIKRRMEQNQHKLSSLVPESAPSNRQAPAESGVAPVPTPAAVPSHLTPHEQEQVKTLRTALANDAQLVSQLLARRTHTQFVLWNELRYVHEASADGIRAIWKRWTREERAFVMEEFGAGLHALEMLLMEL